VIAAPPPKQIVVQEFVPPDPGLETRTTPPGGRPPSQTENAGIVTPTPETDVDPDVTAATQEDLAESGLGPVGNTPSSGTGDGPVGTSPPEPYVPEIERQAPPLPSTAELERNETEPTSTVFESVEVQPVLIGGIGQLQAGIEYPSFDRTARNQGQVVVQFVVDEAGVPSQIVVVRSVSPGLDEAAAQAVRRARFEPGRQNGRPVKVRFSLPVTFRIR
jgi:TonB family protein